MYHNKPNTAVRRVAEVLTSDTNQVIELVHTLCKNNRICVEGQPLQAQMKFTLGTPTLLGEGTYVTKVQVSGELIYQPVAGCGINGCNPCPQEDIIFATFKVYTDSDDVEIVSCASVVDPLVNNPCENYTNRVLICTPYEVKVGAPAKKSTKKEV